MKNNKKEFINNKTYKEYFYKLIEVISFLCIFLFLIFMQLFFMTLRFNEYLKQEENQNSIDTASAYSFNEVTPYNTITDLTGTSWLLNINLGSTTPAGRDYSYGVSHSFNEIYNLNFISNSINYTQFYFRGLGEGGGTVLRYDSTIVNSYLSSSGDSYAWVNQEYRTISITGGTGATNSSLISWLQSNATQVQTGYSSTINLTNCTCDKSSETGLSGSYTAIITANTGYYLTNVTTSLGTISYSNNNKFATISIADVTEDFIISATASLIYHNISYNLGNVVVISNKPTQIDEISTLSITFQPFVNFVLPQYINIEGVSSYQWNDETGVLTLTNAYDNVDISINAEYRSGDYTFIELIDSVTLVPVNTFFNLFDFEIFGVNIYSLLLSSLVLFVIIKVILKVFK